MEEPDRRIALDAVRDALDRDMSALDGPADLIAGSFAVEGLIGRGSCFEIVRLRHRDLGSFHALKRPVFEARTDPLLRRLLMDEARRQAAIVHPACLPLRALLRLGDGRPGLLTDFVDAPTLARLLVRRRLAPAEIAALGERIVHALRAVHDAGLVHGDVTPANLFVPNGDPAATILFDFGLSRPLGSALPEDVEIAGTPSFAAPETRDHGCPAAASADLYGLGRVLLASLSEAPPGALVQLAEALTSPVPSDRPRLDETLERLQECGAAATDERKSVSDPETNKPRHP